MSKKLAVTLSIFMLFCPAYASLGQETFKIVVHEDLKTESVAKKKLSKIFLRKVKRWEDGQEATPFDLSDDSQVREDFTRAVHKKKLSHIKSFWQRMIFSGRDNAPSELANESELLERIARTPGSVGYVAAETELPDGVKVLEITEK
ncbi:MAG: hypothetical protein AAF725_25660 [Acidobacteriota bacterium]